MCSFLFLSLYRRDPEVFDIIRRNSTTILKLLRHDANGENRTTIDVRDDNKVRESFISNIDLQYRTR